jgi:putative transposase
MDEYNNKGSDAVYEIKYHFIWVTKYRYPVLKGEIAVCIRELVRQACNAGGVDILQCSVGKEHIHLLVSCQQITVPSKRMQ